VLFLGLELIDEPDATPVDLLLELLEITPVVLTSVGIVLLFRVTKRQRDEHLQVLRDLQLARIQGQRWRSESRSFLNGLGAAIDAQFCRWNLTDAEREVALLLLKGSAPRRLPSFAPSASARSGSRPGRSTPRPALPVVPLCRRSSWRGCSLRSAARNRSQTGGVCGMRIDPQRKGLRAISGSKHVSAACNPYLLDSSLCPGAPSDGTAGPRRERRIHLNRASRARRRSKRRTPRAAYGGEDKRRPVEPLSIDVAGRPLTVGGEYEIGLNYLRRRVVVAAVRQPDRLLLAQELEGEAFYSFGPPLSVFAQLRAVMEEDLLSHTFEEVSDCFVERGEMWLFSEDIAGSRVNLDLGRLHFEDDRRWWWDEELDAVRVAYETQSLEIALAFARELGPNRSDRDHVAPEHDHVRRLIGEASWDWSRNHALQLFLLHENDRSRTERPEEIVRVEREDESDARLTWLGARLIGVFDLRSRGFLGYWLDTAMVRGEERLVEYSSLSPRQSVAEGFTRRHVGGRAVDAGINWLLPIAWEPRLFAGYAFGSGDSQPESGTDRSFRQTGIQANEAGFGGVQRYPHYGVLLDPELSNLGILTIGAGLSLLKSSSLDIVYPTTTTAWMSPHRRCDSQLEVALTGKQRELGTEIDFVLALEEWERLEFEFIASAFRAARAFGKEEGTWSYLGFLAMRIAF
jgi:alginate production protein